MKQQDEIRVVIGAGEYQNNPGWLHTQESELDLLKENDWKNKFNRNSITAILAEHVWEHMTYDEGIEAAKLCFAFLKPGGYVRCAVPDAYFLNEEYQNMVKVGGPGPLDHPAATHKIVHKYKTLTTMFEAAGFHVRLLEYCSEDGAFHSQEWEEKEGFIYRSLRFDHRNKDGQINCVSLIVDAIKPSA